MCDKGDREVSLIACEVRMPNQYIKFGGNVFARLENKSWFEAFVRTQYESAGSEARLQLTMDSRRLWDAHGLWQEDLDRLKTYELNGSTPDHYKQAGHLIYWLRRSSPVIAFNIAGNASLTSEARDFRDLLLRYGNEYLAFDKAHRYGCPRDRTQLG